LVEIDCTELNEISFGFENCECITIPSAYITYISIGNTVDTFEHIEKGMTHTGYFIDPFVIVFDRDLEGYVNQGDRGFWSNVNADYEISYLERIQVPCHISAIDLRYRDGTVKYYAAKWHDIDENLDYVPIEHENRFQCVKVNRHNDVFIVIGKDTELIEKLFPDEKINAVDFTATSLINHSVNKEIP